MSDRNVQIQIKNGASWDKIFPKTKSSIVVLDDGITSVSTKLSAIDTALNGKATPADISTAINAVIGASPDALNTLQELGDALGDDANFASTVTNNLALKAPIANPTFTGTVSGVTKSMVGLSNVDNTTDTNKPVSIAQQTALNLKAPLASPSFSGTPLTPTATAGTNTTQIASTAFVKTAIDTLALSVPIISTTEPTSSNLWYQEI